MRARETVSLPPWCHPHAGRDHSVTVGSTVTTVSVYIYGAGGFGRETAVCARHLGLDIAAFIDDVATGQVMGIDIVRPESVGEGSRVVVAIADPGTRRRIVESLAARRMEWTSVVDASTTWIGECALGSGIVVLPHVHVSVSAIVDEHVHLNYGATIGHDARIGAFSTVLPGAHIAGSVTIGEAVLVGSGATILQGLTIGDGAVIGAGAVVTRDVLPSTTVLGVPARPVER